MLLKYLASSWKELVVCSEGFLTGEGRQGLEKQAVVWGEMVPFYCEICRCWDSTRG